MSMPPRYKNLMLTILLIEYQLNVVNELCGCLLPHDHTDLLCKVSIVVVPVCVCVVDEGRVGGGSEHCVCVLA